MTLPTFTIHDEADAAESFDVTTKFTADPTAATPRYAISAKGTNTPGTFSNGAWSGTWSSTTDRITGTTATIGNGGTLKPLVSGASYWLWQKVTVGSETFLRTVAVIDCP